MNRKALGKGLSALIPEKADKKDKIVQISPEDIIVTNFQPRENFSSGGLEKLISSIKKKGIIQPILVREKESKYELIAGERRLRAAKELKLNMIPAIVSNVSDSELMQISLIENLQREDLNPIEEAKAYKKLIDVFGFAQEKIAQEIGKNPSSVSNILRLLKLPEDIQKFLYEGKITAGHARALLSLESQQDQLKICRQIIRKGLSVRNVESIVSKDKAKRRKVQKRKTLTPELLEMEEKLQRFFGTKVRIIQSGKKKPDLEGKIQIEYYSKSDLERILNLLMLK